jgi:hypothetical protein
MAVTLLKIIYFLASLVFLLKAILSIYIAIMLYKDNYSEKKTKDDCDKASPDILKIICPFWSGDNSKCINGMYDNENSCTPRKSISNLIFFIIIGLLFGLISLYLFHSGLNIKENSYPGSYPRRSKHYEEF